MERRRFATTQGGVSRGDRVDYGQRPPGSMTRQEQWDRREEDYGMSPWYARGGAQMPWSGPPGQERGQRAPIYTPDPADPRNAGYWKNQSTPEEVAADEAAARDRYARKQALLGGDDAYQAAKASGDVRAQIAAMTALKQRMEQDRFVAQGGTPETWQNRYRNENDWPRPGVGGAVPAPGPRPAGGVPPSQNPMMEGYLGGGQDSARIRPAPLPLLNPMMQGYLGGGAGVSQGPGGFGPAGGGYSPQIDLLTRRGGSLGPGGFGGYGPRNDYMYRGPMPGGYNPEGPYGGVMSPEAIAYRAGQSKSGMGQNWMNGPMATTGNPMGDRIAEMQARGFYIGSPADSMQNTAAYLPPSALAPWMRQSMPGYNMGGGGLGAWLGGLSNGGFGYNPGAQFSPSGGVPWFMRGVPY